MTRPSPIAPLIAVEPLEPRVVLSAPPVVHGLTIPDEAAISGGRPVTVTARVTDDVGVRGVTYFLDYNEDGEWTPGVDRHLGQRFAPDPGTTDRYSLTFAFDWDMMQFDAPVGSLGLRFAVNAVDTDGQWPVNAFTRDVLIVERPVVSQIVALPLNTFETRLTALVDSPFAVPASNPRGVTFWFDANGNGRWDPGIDTHLAYTEAAVGPGGREFTVDVPVNPGWPHPRHFAAAARDDRPSPDRLGPPSVAVERGTGAPPPAVDQLVLHSTAIRPRVSVVAGYAVELRVEWSTPGVTALTFFRDVNQNGLWDYTIDQHLTHAIPTAPGSHTASIVIDKAWGGGRTAIGVALRTDPGVLGNDGWSPVRSVFFVTRFEAWIAPPSSTVIDASPGGAFALDITARDDRAVRSAVAFLDFNGDGRLGPGEPAFAGVRLSSAPGPVAMFRVSLVAPLTPGSYSLGVYAFDFTLPNGPVTRFTLNVA